MIPPIIHQTGPADKKYWHPIWLEGNKIWDKLYPNHLHYTWTDEQIDRLIEYNYPQYWNKYINLPYHALRIDISRLFILHCYGGIYADLDYLPCMNFAHELYGEFVVVGALSDDEVVQNSLMASSLFNGNVLALIDMMLEQYYSKPIAPTTDTTVWNDYIRDTFGPTGISRNLDVFGNNIQILEPKLYNPDFLNHGDDIRGKHMLTGIWGNDVITQYDTVEEFMTNILQWYKDSRYLDYTHHKPGDSL